MSDTKNQCFIYETRPQAEVTDSHFVLKDIDMPTLEDGEVLVKGQFYSTDPYMRIQMAATSTWEAPRELGHVQEGGVVGVVEESKDENFKKGEYVYGYLGWRRFATAKGSSLRKLDCYKDFVSPSAALGVLGMPGVTAYCALDSKANLTEKDTLVVSGAAGAVGSLVGQIGKIKNKCRVVGIAGTDAKCDWLTKELGFDAAINYKKEASMKEALKRECPNGIDVYFDNVGGPITDAVFELINLRARIIICGQISQYNGHLDEPAQGPRFLHKLIYTRASIFGILARDFFAAGDNVKAWEELASWLKSGQLKYRENVVDGFENLPKALSGMMQGANVGKQVVKAW